MIFSYGRTYITTKNNADSHITNLHKNLKNKGLFFSKIKQAVNNKTHICFAKGGATDLKVGRTKSASE
jgi:hypothetical protein